MHGAHQRNRQLRAVSSSGAPWARVAELARRQHGVASLAQLLAAGLTERAVLARCRGGQLHRIHRGVYAVGHTSLSRRGRFMGAVLACGPGAALSHRSAAALHDLCADNRSVIDVTVSCRTVRPRPGILPHTADLVERDLTAVDSVPVTSLARTLLDLSAVTDVTGLRRAYERAEQLRVLDLTYVDEVLKRNKHSRGYASLRALAAEHRSFPVTRSELERRMARVCEDASLPPPIANATVDLPGGPIEVDFLWPAQRLVVETDGFETHGTRAAFERDRRRDQRLVAAGYRVVRFTWRQVVRDAKGTGRAIERLLAAASLPTPAP